MNMAASAEIQSTPIEIDPRPCELCGRTVDQHECFDDGEGPEFFCYPEGDLVTQWELADPRDRWKHTGEPPPDIGIPMTIAKQPYRTPQSTVDAFFYMLKTKDAAGIAAWLAAHPRDERHLQKIWERKCSTAAAK
jgi:hypothetical protein